MVPLLLAALAVCCMLIVILVRARKARSRELAYIHAKLDDIVERGSSERLLLATGDRELQTLLVDINRLLEHNGRTKAGYARTEMSIKKMLANMSHDLKTPLTVVLGLTETLASDRSLREEERERLLAKVHDKAQDMLALMNKFFDLARLESGDMELPLKKTDVGAVCRNGILFFYESITAHGLEAAIDIPQTPVYALGNEEALERILNNLLSNAIRYGGDGGVVGLTLRCEDEHVWIDVWDRGKGIDERHRQLIFERLYTLEDSRNRLYQGSGLGLAITKSLTEKLGGSIKLASSPGEKTVFTLQFRRIR
jgi:signal transduction histidine kinase